MEMKRKQTHILNRCSNRGFTMVELLIAMVVALLALAGIYSTFLSQHRSYKIQEETSQMQQNIRTAMFFMQREIRMAGSNPYKSLPLASFGITAANSNLITVTEDVRSGIPPVEGPPEGLVNVNNVPDEDITYTLNGTNLDRTDNNLNGGLGDTQTVAQNIDWLDFVYLDGNGAVTATLTDIESVEITIVARTRDQLPLGIIDNNTYWNQQGTASWTAPGDSASRRRLTTLIHCRNL